ncbi:hypothetical protein EF908_24155 [Streptomyces sp. WAC04770]|nr:class V lanthionine synthetase subunit LxmK [Streptomyces sp. WAC04770]RST21056.1 hypothetical protein EF908_24155 [Streptomyces sp. WAC04770]
MSLTPVALDTVPAANTFLGELGLGELDGTDVASYMGRNDNWAGRTSAGVGVFLKHIGGSPQDAEQRIRRSRAFGAAVRAAGHQELTTPELLGYREDDRLLVFALLEGAETGAEMAAADRFDDELAHRAGRITGLLHAAPTEGVDPRPDDQPPALPDPSLNGSLPLAVFTGLTFAEVTFWNLMQNDAGLTDALHRLRAREAAAVHRPGHCDLRLDQFLHADGRLHLTDGEEFRLADPARDIGGFAGEWLYQAVIGLTRPGDGDPDGIGDAAGSMLAPEPTHEEILARGTRELDRLRPRIAAFWAGYRSVRPADPADGDLAARATAFAGWHLIDRAMVSASRGSRLPAVVRAAMGIGRNALLRPEQFASVLGLEESA